MLHLLSLGEAYGYEIVTTLTERTNGGLEVTDGTLYPVLYRLERAGFVGVRWETPAARSAAQGLPADEIGAGRAGPPAPRVERLRQRHGQPSSTAAGGNMSVDQAYIERVDQPASA